jgi:hypothetical protein
MVLEGRHINKTGMAGYLEFTGHTEKELPTIAGTYVGKDLVICADAACVWDDLERFGCAQKTNRGSVWKSGWHFMTVNKMVETLPGDIEHCYSNEPQTLLRFIASRRTEYVREFNAPQQSHSISPGCKWTWPFGGFGTSGFGAALVAIGLGYNRVVLCGMPLEDGHHNGEPHWRRTWFTNEAADSVGSGINRYWEHARKLVFEGKVKSMSGRTKAWLGDAQPWG